MAYQSDKMLLEMGVCSSLALLAATVIPAANLYGTPINRLMVLGQGDVPTAHYREARASEVAYTGIRTDAGGRKWILEQSEYPAELFGAKGDCLEYTDGGTTAASTTFTSAQATFTAADVGKYIMIETAGTGGRQHKTTIAAFVDAHTVELTVAAVATRASAAKYFYGTPDRAACQAMLDFCSQVHGRAVFSAGKKYLIEAGVGQNEPPLRYKSNTSILIRGDIVHAEANGGGFVLCDQYFRVDGTAYTTNLTLAFEGGSIIFPAAWTADAGGLQKKGLGITCTDGFDVSRVRLTGDNVGSFTTQIHRCRNGTWTGSRMDSGNGLGEDGVHLYGNCSDIVLTNLIVESGDDAFSITAETNAGAGGSDSIDDVIERITLSNSVLKVNGFSPIKILTNTTTGAAIIRDVLISNCYAISVSGSSGQVALINNGGAANGARIEDIHFVGCTFDVGSSALVTHQILVNACKNVTFDDCDFSGTRESFINFTYGKDCGVKNSRFVQTVAETTIATGLTVSAINWNNPTTQSVVVTFSGAPDLSTVTTSHKLFLSGATNAGVHDGGYAITAIDDTAKTITITNLKVTTAAADETTGATCYVTTARTNAAIRCNAMEGLFVENNRISDWSGYAMLQSQASAANVYTGLTQNRKLRIVGNRAENCYFGFGFELSTTIDSLIERNRFLNTRGVTFFQEGSNCANNTFEGNVDHDRYFARMASLQAVSGSNTRPMQGGNVGYSGDKWRSGSSVTIPNGAASITLTLTRETFPMSSDGSTVDPLWFRPNHTAACKVTRSGAVLTFTVASAVGSDTAIPFEVRA